jgi:hypothetical protein
MESQAYNYKIFPLLTCPPLKDEYSTRQSKMPLAVRLARLGFPASAALEALTEALTLAEPGGLIRLFVDLGPLMADLLKRLAKKNVDLGYIGKILSSFRDDAQRAVTDTDGPDSSSRHHSLSPSPSLSTSQPLKPKSIKNTP